MRGVHPFFLMRKGVSDVYQDENEALGVPPEVWDWLVTLMADPPFIRDIPSSAWRLLTLLVTHADREGRVVMSQEELAVAMGVRREAVSRIVQQLQEVQRDGQPILRVSGGRFTGLTYYLNSFHESEVITGGR